MNNRVFTAFRRRIPSRQISMIGTFCLTFIICNFLFYFIIKHLILPLTIETTTTSTTTTTETTTTEETTTEETTTEKPPEFGCFHLSTNITLADGSIQSLRNLRVGDEIRIYSSSNEIRTNRILTIFHHYRLSIVFIEIFVDDQLVPLRLTRSHSLFVRKKFSSNFHFDFASNIEIGDFLLSANLVEKRVTKMKKIHVENEEIATILTDEGNFIANDLIVSSYATFSHWTMHFLSKPVRFWLKMNLNDEFEKIYRSFIDLFPFFVPRHTIEQVTF